MLFCCISCAKAFTTQRSLQNHCSQLGCVFKPPPVPQSIIHELSFQRDFSSMPAALSSTNHTLLHFLQRKTLNKNTTRPWREYHLLRVLPKKFLTLLMADGGMDGNDGNRDDGENGTINVMECVEHLQNHKNSHFKSMKWNLPPPMIAQIHLL